MSGPIPTQLDNMAFITDLYLNADKLSSEQEYHNNSVTWLTQEHFILILILSCCGPIPVLLLYKMYQLMTHPTGVRFAIGIV